MLQSLILFGAYLLFFCCNSLTADRVETRDGSVLYGSIITAEDGNLSFQTNNFGTFDIPLKEIVSLSSSENISVRDEQNNTLLGQSIPQPKMQLNLRNEGKSTSLEFPEIQHIWTADSTDPLVLKSQAEKMELMMKWKNSVGFDLVGSSGNTDSFGAGLRLDSTYSNQLNELDLFLSYNTQTTNGKTDADETKGGVAYDSLFRQRLAWYTRADFEHDPIEQINLRSTGALGIKYDLIEDTHLELSSRVGSAIRYEDSTIGTISKKTDPAFDLGLEYSQLFFKSLLMESELTLLPKADDLSDYLFNHDTAIVFPILEENKWHIRSGISGTFDSIPKEESEKMDMKYYFRVVYDFN